MLRGHHLRDARKCILAAGRMDAVIHAKTPAIRAGSLAFILPPSGVADRERLQLRPYLAARHRRHQRRIHPAAEKNAQRHIRDPLPPHCVLDGRIHGVGGFFSAKYPVRLIRQSPPSPLLHTSIGLHHEKGAGFELIGVLEQRIRRRDMVQPQVESQHVFAHITELPPRRTQQHIVL